MKRFCILLTAILLSSVLNAQQTRWFKTSDPTVTVSGVITDDITGEGIQFASVVANGDRLNHAMSDSDGIDSPHMSVWESEPEKVPIERFPDSHRTPKMDIHAQHIHSQASRLPSSPYAPALRSTLE